MAVAPSGQRLIVHFRELEAADLFDLRLDKSRRVFADSALATSDSFGNATAVRLTQRAKAFEVVSGKVDV
jgi:hypothetical protein